MYILKDMQLKDVHLKDVHLKDMHQYVSVQMALAALVHPSQFRLSRCRAAYPGQEASDVVL